MPSMNKINSHSVDYKFNLTESFIEEFEEYGRKFFNDNSLKLGFRLSDRVSHISLREYLVDHSSDEGEFTVYFIRNKDFNTLDEKVSHDTHKNKIFIGKFCLIQLPGCCGICVLYHCMIDSDLRGNKFGQYMMKLEKIIAIEKDFTVMICTDVIKNIPQKTILKKFGFTSRFTFQNKKKTKNYVELQSVDLTDENYYDVIWKKKYSIFQKLKSIKKSLKKTFSTVLTIK